MIADLLIARLKAEAASFGDRVEGAMTLAPLLEQGVFPAVTPAAFVVPTGITSASGLSSSTGLHRQTLTRGYDVLWLVTYAGSASGGEVTADLEAIENEIIQALAGYVAVPGQGSLRLTRSVLNRAVSGTFLWTTSFAFDDYLRVSP
jgi:hypothetical protein